MLQSISSLQSYGTTQLSGGATFGGGVDLASGSTSGLDVLSLASASNPYVSGAFAIGDLLGIDLKTNFSNVLKYGLSSWGASTDPQKQQQRIDVDMNKLQDLIQSTNDSNLVENINRMEFISTYVAQYYKKMLARRKWAGSTTEAFKIHQKVFEQFRSEVLTPMIDKLRAIGAKVSYVTNTDEFYKYEAELLPWNAPDNTSAEKNGTFTYRVYSILMPVKPNVKVDEQGNLTTEPTSEAGMGSLVGIGVAVALAKIFKFF